MFPAFLCLARGHTSTLEQSILRPFFSQLHQQASPSARSNPSKQSTEAPSPTCTYAHFWFTSRCSCWTDEIALQRKAPKDTNDRLVFTLSAFSQGSLFVCVVFDCHVFVLFLFE
eukprot:m.162512 g.162512  ORF g.162512 m.162512 type:complete len:114 (-) comp24884_c0_seq5:64-405(-)